MVGNIVKGIININYKVIVKAFMEIYSKVIVKVLMEVYLEVITRRNTIFVRSQIAS